MKIGDSIRWATTFVSATPSLSCAWYSPSAAFCSDEKFYPSYPKRSPPERTGTQPSGTAEISNLLIGLLNGVKG